MHCAVEIFKHIYNTSFVYNYKYALCYIMYINCLKDLTDYVNIINSN